MNFKLRFLLVGILLSFKLFAEGYMPSMTSQDQPWSVIASFGYGKYRDVNPDDAENAIGRLAFGNELMLTGDYALGLELGLQSGNQMRLQIPQETLRLLSWLPVQTTLGPMLDLLVTAKSDSLGHSAVFAQIKGGVIYRYWKIKQAQLSDLSQLAAEIQAGFGYPITALANLNLLYQGVFSGDPNINFYKFPRPATLTAIPPLHAVLLGLSVNL